MEGLQKWWHSLPKKSLAKIWSHFFMLDLVYLPKICIFTLNFFWFFFNSNISTLDFFFHKWEHTIRWAFFFDVWEKNIRWAKKWKIKTYLLWVGCIILNYWTLNSKLHVKENCKLWIEKIGLCIVNLITLWSCNSSLFE